jgi:hypothetical protein
LLPALRVNDGTIIGSVSWGVQDFLAACVYIPFQKAFWGGCCDHCCLYYGILDGDGRGVRRCYRLRNHNLFGWRRDPVQLGQPFRVEIGT